MAYESSLFSLDMEDTIVKIYGAKTQQAIARLTSADGGAGDDDDDDAADKKSRDIAEKAIDYLHSIAFKLFSACVGMNEAPSIRHSKSEAASVVAKEVHSLLNSYMRKNRDTFKPWGSDAATGRGGAGGRGSDDEGDISLTGRRLSPGEPAEPATLIILDRMDDVASALLHDVTYSSLVVDLLHHVPTTPLLFDYKAKASASSASSGQPAASKKYECLLDEADPVWRSLRYEEMASILDATDELARCMRARESRRKASGNEDGKDLEELRRLMNVLASGEKQLDSKIAQHYRMRKAIESRFEKRRLHALISLEQALATGVDASGSKISRSDIDAAMKKLLQETAQDKQALRDAIKRGERKDAEDEKLKPLLRAV
jgi:Sec1 family